MNQNLSSFLDLCRWVSASLVLVSHVRSLLFVDWNDVEGKSLFLRVLYFFTGFGHEAVVVFFVISGFLVGGITLERWIVSGPSVRSYVSARFSRIYVVLIPALLLGFLVDNVGLSFLNSSGLYFDIDSIFGGAKKDIVRDLSVSTFLGNVFVLQTVLVGTLGTNGPLWSLANEWWYYILFLLIAYACLGVHRFYRISSLVSLLVIVFVLPATMVLWMAVWGVGVGGYFLVARVGPRIRSPILGIVLFLVVLGCARVGFLGGFGDGLSGLILRDLLLGVSFVIALIFVSQGDGLVSLAGFNRSAADFSFSLYCVHFPISVFLVAAGYEWFQGAYRSQPSLLGFFYMGLIVLLVLMVCYVFSIFTERRTLQVRNYLDRILFERCRLL